jgi:hypothetical protein
VNKLAVAELGRWSIHAWDSADSVPYPVALAATFALAFTALRVARTAVGSWGGDDEGLGYPPLAATLEQYPLLNVHLDFCPSLG